MKEFVLIVTVVIGPSGSTIRGVIVRVISKSDQCELEVTSTVTPGIVPQEVQLLINHIYDKFWN